MAIAPLSSCPCSGSWKSYVWIIWFSTIKALWFVSLFFFIITIIISHCSARHLFLFFCVFLAKLETFQRHIMCE